MRGKERTDGEMPADAIIHITFLRHGRSRADDEGVYEGRYDSPLTAAGYAQAQQRARDFQERGLRFDLVVSSPLQRARATAEIIGQALNAPLAFDEDWMERDTGPLAGMKPELAAVQYPKPAFRNPYEPLWETGESAWALYRRAARAVEKVVRRGAGRYLVVAHGGILNAALRTIMGTPPRGGEPEVVFRFGDLGYASLTYQPRRHRWQLLAFAGGLPADR